MFEDPQVKPDQEKGSHVEEHALSGGKASRRSVHSSPWAKLDYDRRFHA